MSAAAPRVEEILEAFPPMPVTDTYLVDLYENPAIDTVWVPTDRHCPVNVDGGVFEGNIYHFLVETDEQVVKSVLSSVDDPDGPRWKRSKQNRNEVTPSSSTVVGEGYRLLDSAGGYT